MGKHFRFLGWGDLLLHSLLLRHLLLFNVVPLLEDVGYLGPLQGFNLILILEFVYLLIAQLQPVQFILDVESFLPRLNEVLYSLRDYAFKFWSLAELFLFLRILKQREINLRIGNVFELFQAKEKIFVRVKHFIV